MGILGGWTLGLVFLSAGFFYHAGDQDEFRGIIYASISLLLSAAALFLLGMGFWGVFMLQLLFVAALTAKNIYYGPPGR